jgi:hypothetical protein
MKTFFISVLFLLGTQLHASEWVSYPVEGVTKPVSGVGHLAGQFVAWGEGLYVSPDGSEWEEVELPLNQSTIAQVFHTETGWVLFAYNSRGWMRDVRLSSKHLQDWEMIQAEDRMTFPTHHAKGRFYNLAGNTLLSSVDGLTWAEVPLGLDASDYLTGLSPLGDTLYLLASDRYWTSTDGVQWTLVPTPLITDGFGSGVGATDLVEYRGWTFARVYGQLYRSQDRLQWELLHPLGIHNDVPLGEEDQVTQFAKTEHALYAATRSGRVLFTNDGTHWGTTGRPFIPAVNAFGDPVLGVPTSTQPLAASGEMLVITDGRDIQSKRQGGNWQKRSDAYWDREGKVPQWFAGRYFVGGQESQLWSSEDGIRWRTDFKHAGVGDWQGTTFPTSSFTDAGLRLSQGNGILMAMGYGDWVMLTRNGGLWAYHQTTLDGKIVMPVEQGRWGLSRSESIDTPVFQEGRWLSYGAVHVNNHPYLTGPFVPISSADGIHWVSEARVPDGLEIYRIERAAGNFVALGTWLYHSADGQSWTEATVEGLTPAAVSGAFRGLVLFNGAFLVPGDGGQVFQSLDGKNWTLLNVPVEGFVANGSIFRIGDTLYLGSRSGDSAYVSMNPAGDFAPVSVLPEAISPVAGDAPLQLALGSRTQGSLLLRTEDLPNPVIEVTSLWEQLQEGEGSRATFSVKRHGDINQTLEVMLSFVGDALPGIDFLSNLEQRGDRWVLRFDPGYPVLHVWIEAMQDGIAEGDETVALWIRNHPNYRVGPASAVALVSLSDKP